MKLTLTLLAACLRLSFTTPGAGSFWLVSTQDGLRWDVEMCQRVDLATHVTYVVPANETHRMFTVWWEGD